MSIFSLVLFELIIVQTSVMLECIDTFLQGMHHIISDNEDSNQAPCIFLALFVARPPYLLGIIHCW
jgi:hypothetical protein